MNADVTGHVGRPRQKAGVMLTSRLDPGGDIRSISQKPDLVASADGEAARIHRQAHRAVKCANQRRKPLTAGPHGQQLIRLVGADKQRHSQFVQQGDKAFALCVVEGDGGRSRGLRISDSRDCSLLSSLGVCRIGIAGSCWRSYQASCGRSPPERGDLGHCNLQPATRLSC